MNMCVPAKLLLLCLILCDPMDCNSPCSSVRGILQARILEWVAMPFSRGSWLAPKKVTVTVLWSAAHLIHYSFLNPYETVISEKYILQINEMHQKLQCPQPALVNRKGPIFLQDNAWLHIEQQTLPTVEQIGLRSFVSSAIFTWPLTNWLPLLQASWQIFAGKMFPQPTGGKTCFQDLIKSQSTDFYATGKMNLLLIDKNMLILMVLILMNEDVFEPRYKDLISWSETIIMHAPT